MIKARITETVAILTSLLLIGCASPQVTRIYSGPERPTLNTVTFDNKCGKPALVKLVGRKITSVEVPNGTAETVVAPAGHYFIKVRFGVVPPDPEYSYTRGDEFDVTQTPASVARITITLHPVAHGNYRSRSISAAEFDDDRSVLTTGMPR